ncbi:MAG: aminoacetone oxidase family FAD-binding enzyme [Candidatus Pacebacteria bacterium]|nr:aminoacetone oxidase family FAD-binding enzyme [Candidatus Paceibacterota bacterium]
MEHDVIIIGSGPAGLMCAIQANKRGKKVLLVEKNHNIGGKLPLTGNGRCNITNAEFDIKKLIEKYGKNGKFLFNAFNLFGPKELIEFFESQSLKIKIEDNKRAFPVTNSAKDVVDVLESILINVDVLCNSRMTDFTIKNKQIESIKINNKEYKARNYVFCSGGGSFDLIKKTGHTINKITPALASVKIKDPFSELSGVSIDVLIKKPKIRGEMLFTHFGLSGPVILNASKKISNEISIDLAPDIKELNIDKNKLLKNSDFLPSKVVLKLLELAGINPNKKGNQLTKAERFKLFSLIKNMRFEVLEIVNPMVVGGGVSLKEIDSKTMKSKIIDNLFFAGEVVDIDGPTGGYNLQFCWSTGYLAGTNLD